MCQIWSSKTIARANRLVELAKNIPFEAEGYYFWPSAVAIDEQQSWGDDDSEASTDFSVEPVWLFFEGGDPPLPLNCGQDFANFLRWDEDNEDEAERIDKLLSALEEAAAKVLNQAKL